jgi:hypothetical protein
MRIPTFVFCAHLEYADFQRFGGDLEGRAGTDSGGSAGSIEMRAPDDWLPKGETKSPWIV